MFGRITKLILVLASVLAIAGAPVRAQETRRQQRREAIAAARAQRREQAREKAAAAAQKEHQDANKPGTAPAEGANAHPAEASAAQRPGGDGRALAGLPPKWTEKLQDMSPGEQERFMRNNERFKSLPPKQQAQIRQRMQLWNRLSPDEREVMRDREQAWERMTPDQRQYVRNELLPRWQQMPPERRQLLMGRLHTLRGMSGADREAQLNDPKFMQGLSPQEQQTLRDLDHLRNPPATP